MFAGQPAADGSFDLALDQDAALALVSSAGGTVTANLLSQVGLVVVESSSALFADALRGSPFVEDVGQNFTWKALLTYDETVAAGAVVSDPGEALQWDMMQIRAPEAHAFQAGWHAVDVGVLDTGIDGRHADFFDLGIGTNVDCARGRDLIPLGLGIGVPDPCTDNDRHRAIGL